MVRGKCPPEDVVEMARQRDMVVLVTDCRMFSACGRLYAAGLGAVKEDIMETVKLTYEIDGDNFNAAGDASTAVKRVLKKLRLPAQIVRRAVVCMYEGEINMVIHADGGVAELEVDEEKIVIVLKDKGPGIPDIDKAMEEGWSTASPTVRARGFGAGMGLPNMKRNADEMDIQTTLGVGTTVTMVIYIGGDGK